MPDGSLMEITKVYPLDAVFDNLEDVPEDVMEGNTLHLFIFMNQEGYNLWDMGHIFIIFMTYKKIIYFYKWRQR